jgi:hypothetical protein
MGAHGIGRRRGSIDRQAVSVTRSRGHRRRLGRVWPYVGALADRSSTRALVGSLTLWSFRSFRFVSKQNETIKRLIFRSKMLVVSSFHRFSGEGLPAFNLAVDGELK